MSDLAAEQRAALRQWGQQAIEAGWLSDESLQRLDQATVDAPGQLFNHADRPLVVGLFGGTGVGKSTLLNRFAQQAIARTSAERPTSRAVTVYAHNSVTVDRLPSNFPSDKLHTAQHDNDRLAHMLFVDMPDFDSVEEANRDLVDVWLPHLDVVLYVVSPERYRDDQGWRLLLAHGAEHAWLFVINQWDRGDEQQIQDFQQQLTKAGLSDPVIFTTDCSPTVMQSVFSLEASAPNEPVNPQNASVPVSTSTGDQFTDLLKALEQLAVSSIVQTLDEHGIVARLQSLKSCSDHWLDSISTGQAIEEVQKSWQAQMRDRQADLQHKLGWKLEQLAAAYQLPSSNWWHRLMPGRRDPDPVARISPDQTASQLLDDAFRQTVNTDIQRFLQSAANHHGLPFAALQLQTEPRVESILPALPGKLTEALMQSLAAPSNVWHRGLYRALGLACALLPLMAMAWIAYRVLTGFVAGASDPSAYLGTGFAVNSILLVILAWLIPALIQPLVRPSPVTAARRGLQAGLTTVSTDIFDQVEAGLIALDDDAASRRNTYHALWTQLPEATSEPLPDSVRRLLVDTLNQPESDQPLVARATTHNSTEAAPLS